MRLQQQLAIEKRTALFKPNGELIQTAVGNAVRLPLRINNPEVKQALSERRGNLIDWSKYESAPVHTDQGLARMHFYRNPITKDTYYGMDYKAVFDHQGNWNVEPSRKFTMQPSNY